MFARLSGSFSLGALYGLPASSRAIWRTMDRSNGVAWAFARARSPGTATDTKGNAEAARKSLRFMKQPAVTDGALVQRNAHCRVPCVETELPLFPMAPSLAAGSQARLSANPLACGLSACLRRPFGAF